MSDPTDMIVPLLQQMREETSAGFARVEKRLEKIEVTQVSFRQALTADSLFSKLVTGEFQERIEALEQKVRELESHK